MTTIRLITAMVVHFEWKVHQLDIKTTFLNDDLQEEVYVSQSLGQQHKACHLKKAFLNGDLQEEVYVSQSPGFAKAGQQHKVCHLKRALYGFKASCSSLVPEDSHIFD